MFDCLQAKINRSLFVFLSSFGLVISVLVFCILANYNYRNYINLAASQMEQQQQNIIKQIAVVQEHTRLFCAGDLFQNFLRSGDWAGAKARMVEFTVSSNLISNTNIYVAEADGLRRVTSYPTYDFTYMPAAKVSTLLQQQPTKPYNAAWILREHSSGLTVNFSLVYPIYNGTNLLGVMVADVNLPLSATQEGESLFASEELFLVSADNRLATATLSSSLAQELRVVETNTPTPVQRHIIAKYALPACNDFLVIRISIDMFSMFLPLGLTLLGVYLASLLLFFFASKRVTHSIVLPLQNLNKKMQTTLQQQ